MTSFYINLSICYYYIGVSFINRVLFVFSTMKIHSFLIIGLLLIMSLLMLANPVAAYGYTGYSSPSYGYYNYYQTPYTGYSSRIGRDVPIYVYTPRSFWGHYFSPYIYQTSLDYYLTSNTQPSMSERNLDRIFTLTSTQGRYTSPTGVQIGLVNIN